MEGPRTRREGLRRVAAVGDDASGASGALGAEVQAQGGRSRGLDPRQGGDAAVAGLQAVPSQRTQGAEEEARGVRVRSGRSSG